MSHIFEALQHAEEERSGDVRKQPAESVAEILQAASLLQAADSVAAPAPPSDSPTIPSLVQETEVEAPDFTTAKLLSPVPTEKSRLVSLTDQGSLGAEKFRVLGLRLRHFRELRKVKRVVITSSIPGEGKTLVAANLALNQSRSKVLKTVLVDGDLRRSEVGSRFGFSRNLPGLSEVLRGERPLSEVVYKLEGAGMWLLPGGVPPENPIEIMQSGRLEQLLEQLGMFFDWIIIDTPPLHPLADTSVWMRLADGVLLVVREGVSEKKQLERTVELLDSSRVLGVLVNSCDSNEQKYYYSRYAPAVTGSQSSSSVAEN